MKKTIMFLGLTVLLGLAAEAQVTQPTFPPGKIAVFKAGDSSGVFNISVARSQPVFIQAFDTVATNQTAPLVSVAMSTNASVPGSVFINAHAGSEGGGISRSVDRQFLALEGYTGTILPPNASKPSAVATYTVTNTVGGTTTVVTNTVTVTRGIVRLDAFANADSVYSDQYNWFGLPNGVTQNNPTGIATTDGTNFWGTGNVTGTSSEAAGLLYLNWQNYLSEEQAPEEVENYIQAAAEARIIGGTLYVQVPGLSTGKAPGGLYNFYQPGTTTVVPLPYDPNVANPWNTFTTTNLFLNWGPKFANIANFDMNPQGTIAYGADQTYGIVLFTNNAGTWVQAPYYFSTTNIGSILQPKAQQGCFGICVDFSSTNPVIYATTMEYGAGTTGNAQGNANANRLIKIVDTGVNPGTNLVAITLATAATTNETFRGIDFTPDLRPLIATQPVASSSPVHSTASFAVAAQSAYPLSYQWLQETASATNYITNATSATLTLANLNIGLNGDTYQVVVTNVYGAVTSTPALLTVTTTAVPPSITNAVAYVTNYIGGSVTLAAILPNGTQPFTYQWYQGATPLSDFDTSDDGATYGGSTNNTLTITGLGPDEAGNYYLAVTNDAGGILKLVDVVTVNYQPPTIADGGQPQPQTVFTGGSVALTVTPSGGSQPLNYQWYQNGAPLTDPGPSGDISGSQASGVPSSTLTISPASLSDSASYSVVVSNPGGNVTSSVVAVTVEVAPPLSSVSYSNQVYYQTFDSLPDPGTQSQNSFNNGYVSGDINGVAYSLANPFDFAYPVVDSGFIGGLGLASTMSGWYGAADTEYTGVSGYTRFGAQDGDQTTGGVIDFGPNDGSGITGTNRALGLLSTGTTGSTTFGLKLINTSTNALTYVNIGFIGELWHNGTTARTMSFGYALDPTADTFDLSAESITNAGTVLVSNLFFSFPTAGVVTKVDGTQPANQQVLGTNNLALATPWLPNTALWLIWSINYYGSGSGNGYAIDNLSFSATTNAVVTVPVSQPTLGGITYSSTGGIGFSFTNAPGASSQFTVYSTTNLVAPVIWTPLGHPVETPNGSFSTYTFSDPSATNAQKFYQVAP